MVLKDFRPAVSVIIPIYNSESYLSKCLTSLMQQSLKNVEFILVDDGSTDSSNKIIKKYIEEDSRFYLIAQKNSGVGAARNSGIKQAKGEYISFVDSDDYIESNMLEDMYSNARLKNADIIVCRYKQVNSDNKIIQLGPDYSDFDKEVMFKSLLSMRIPSVCWNGLYKNSLFQQTDCLFPCKDMYNEDTATLYKLFYYANSVEFLNSFYYYWHYTPNSKSNSISFKHIDDMNQIVLSFKEFLVEQNIYSQYKYEVIHAYFKGISKKIFQIEHFAKEKTRYLIYLMEKFNIKESIYTMEDILTLKNTYPFIYFNTLLLLKQISGFNIPLLKYFVKKDQKIIDNIISRNCGLEQVIYDYISNNFIKELYIYGTGNFLNTFLDKIGNHQIKIVQILDIEPKILNQFTPVLYAKSLNDIQIKKNSKIVVLSLSSAKEITERIQKYSDKNSLNLKIINFYNCINSKF